jgi:hypothetical protein
MWCRIDDPEAIIQSNEVVCVALLAPQREFPFAARAFCGLAGILFTRGNARDATTPRGQLDHAESPGARTSRF